MRLERDDVREDGDVGLNGAHSGGRKFVDKGGMLAREAFHDNRKRVTRNKLLKLRGELIERTFAFACETGGPRRVRLPGETTHASGTSLT